MKILKDWYLVELTNPTIYGYDVKSHRHINEQVLYFDFWNDMVVTPYNEYLLKEPDKIWYEQNLQDLPNRAKEINNAKYLVIGNRYYPMGL